MRILFLSSCLGYVVSLIFIFLYFIAIQVVPESQDKILVIFSLVFVAIFDAPHIFITFLRSHFDPTEFKRRKILHIIAPIVALSIALSVRNSSTGALFSILLGLYGAWHITRQNIGLVSLFQGQRDRSANILFYSVFGYFVMNNEPSSKELWLQVPWDPVIEPLRWLSLIAVILSGLYFLVKYSRHNSRTFIFTLVTSIYFIGLTHAPVHPLLITAMATIAHNIQYQVLMWKYQELNFKPWVNKVSLGVCFFIGLIVVLAPDDSPWDIIAYAYMGTVLWHYFIDGYIWRFRQAPELQSLTKI
ncbi:MAG: hypothetical protein B7Y39_14145 [Bdellovibrio sp. 28-41-41]|nr:MAG: hypothetical protein B7Y39_14145 [Bdellovibrio sp. 28-41-41]